MLLATKCKERKINMTVQPLPSFFLVEEQTFSLEGHVSVFESPLSRASQQQVRGGSRWRSDVILAPMAMKDARPVLAWLENIQASGDFFTLGDVESRVPQGAATGTPLLDGANQTGSSLSTKGWTASVTALLKAGDFIQIGDELKRVVSDVNSDAGGNAVVHITPPMRGSFADGISLVTADTSAVMRLIDNSQASFNSGADGVVSIRMSAVEIF